MGLGNPTLSDDAVGLRVVAELRSRLDRQELAVTEISMAGLNSQDLLAGYGIINEDQTF